jgi:hypothetical protein
LTMSKDWREGEEPSKIMGGDKLFWFSIQL